MYICVIYSLGDFNNRSEQKRRVIVGPIRTILVEHNTNVKYDKTIPTGSTLEDSYVQKPVSISL